MTRQPIHHHYNQLSEDEREFVDVVFDRRFHAQALDGYGIKLAGDDRFERVVDALARCVIESRPKPKPRVRIPAGRDPEVVEREAARERLEEQRRDHEADLDFSMRFENNFEFDR